MHDWLCLCINKTLTMAPVHMSPSCLQQSTTTYCYITFQGCTKIPFSCHANWTHLLGLPACNPCLIDLLTDFFGPLLIHIFSMWQRLYPFWLTFYPLTCPLLTYITRYFKLVGLKIVVQYIILNTPTAISFMGQVIQASPSHCPCSVNPKLPPGMSTKMCWFQWLLTDPLIEL